MSCCRTDKRKYNCGSIKQNARCVYYSEELPDYSKLKDTCVTLEDTTKELYENQDKILKQIDLSELGKSCIDYTPYKKKSDILELKEALLAMEKEICALKNALNGKDGLNGVGFDMSGLDLKCFGDKCSGGVGSLKDLLQKLIDEHCKNKTKDNGTEVWAK